MPRDELRETRKSVGDAFDGPEPRWSSANRREECRQERCRGFVAPVAEQAGQTDAKHSAVEPGLLFSSFRHEGAVYRPRTTIKSSENKRPNDRVHAEDYLINARRTERR